jgi:polysaccharide biosynthesis/export protein
MINAFLKSDVRILARYSCALLFIIFFLNSCKTFQPPTYFQNASRDTTINKFVNNDFELKIRKSDIMGVGIASISMENAAAFNNVTASGYPVDNDGNIEILKVGKVHAEGLTKKELKEKIEKELVPYLVDPLVTVKFLNHRVTVIGDVGHPQVYPMPEDPLNLIELIAASGEINASGRRDNILIIRDVDSVKQFRRVNLDNTSVFGSKNYYLKPGDIVYVESKKVKVLLTTQTTQLVSLIISGVSFVLLLLKTL